MSSSTSNRAWSSCARCESAPAHDGCSSACLRCNETGLSHYAKRSDCRTSPIRSTSSSTTRNSCAASLPKQAGRWESRSSTGARSGSTRQLVEELRVPVEPRLEREPFDGPVASRRRVGRPRRQDLHDGVGQRLRRRWFVTFPPVRMRNADPCFVAHELHGAAAGWVDDGQTASHRLDHCTRARILDLRVQKEMRTPDEAGRVALRVPADELNAIANPKL